MWKRSASRERPGNRAHEVAHGQPSRAAVIGAGLAALRGTEAMRQTGFSSSLTIVGAEPYRPCDWPPLWKHVPAGEIAPVAATLPSSLDENVVWHLGSPAVRLDRAARVVHRADGTALPYDRLQIATGTRARPWPTFWSPIVGAGCRPTPREIQQPGPSRTRIRLPTD